MTAPSCGSRTRSSAIHSMKNCVLARTFCWYSVCSIACPVRSAAAQARIAILTAVVLRMAAERALVDPAVLEAVEGDPHVLELDHHLDGATAHVFDRVL